MINEKVTIENVNEENYENYFDKLRLDSIKLRVDKKYDDVVIEKLGFDEDWRTLDYHQRIVKMLKWHHSYVMKLSEKYADDYNDLPF